MTPGAYEAFLEATKAEVVPLTKVDAAQAALMKPGREDLLDALIAATARRYDASVWTLDTDYLKFLPKARVRLLRP